MTDRRRRYHGAVLSRHSFRLRPAHWTPRVGISVAFVVACCTPVVPSSSATKPEHEARSWAMAVPHAHEAVVALAGKSLGYVRERLTPSTSGYQLRRSVLYQYVRDAIPRSSELRIVIEIDNRLHARSVWVQYDWPHGIVDHAVRRGDTWVVQRSGEAPQMVTSAAEPAELLPYLHSFRHPGPRPVFLTDRRLALAQLSTRRIQAHRYQINITTQGFGIRSHIELAPSQALQRVTGPSLFSETICDPCPRQLDAPDILAMTRIPVVAAADGSPNIGLHNLSRQPIAMSGQTISGNSTAWRIHPSAIELTGIEARELRTMVAVVAGKVRQDLSAPSWFAVPATTRPVPGDCTMFARRFQQLARQRGYRTHLVTGWRIGATHAFRHRWVVAQTQAGWTAVDPSFGEAPGAVDALVALSFHADDAVSLATADLVFMGTERAHVSARSEGHSPQ